METNLFTVQDIDICSSVLAQNQYDEIRVKIPLGGAQQPWSNYNLGVAASSLQET